MTVPQVNTPEAHPGLPLLALLLGLDGTGRLFTPLQAALDASEQAVTVTYPEDIPLDEHALLAWVGARLPRREPFLLVAESFSGPVAMAVAASAPLNLLGLILVATFAEPPSRPPRWCVRLPLPWLFRLPPPAFALRWLLLGPGAPQGLVRGLRDALRAVAPAVLGPWGRADRAGCRSARPAPTGPRPPPRRGAGRGAGTATRRTARRGRARAASGASPGRRVGGR